MEYAVKKFVIDAVSILGLMDLWISDNGMTPEKATILLVSILGLMDLWISVSISACWGIVILAFQSLV